VSTQVRLHRELCSARRGQITRILQLFRMGTEPNFGYINCNPLFNTEMVEAAACFHVT
jgi:hypothetical protein